MASSADLNALVEPYKVRFSDGLPSHDINEAEFILFAEAHTSACQAFNHPWILFCLQKIKKLNLECSQESLGRNRENLFSTHHLSAEDLAGVALGGWDAHTLFFTDLTRSIELRLEQNLQNLETHAMIGLFLQIKRDAFQERTTSFIETMGKTKGVFISGLHHLENPTAEPGVSLERFDTEFHRHKAVILIPKNLDGLIPGGLSNYLKMEAEGLVKYNVCTSLSGEEIPSLYQRLRHLVESGPYSLGERKAPCIRPFFMRFTT